MKRISTSIILALAAIFSAAAQQAMPSLLISSDPASFAHAGASVAMKADAFSLDNNTAAMSFYEGHMDAALSYSLWQPSGSKNNLVSVGAFGRIGKRVGIGASAKFMLNQPYKITDIDGVQQQLNGSFKPGENNFAIGASCLITDWLSAGVNLKLATSKLAPGYKATAFAADIYAAYKSKFGLNAGLGVCNLGTKAKYSTEAAYSLPSYLRAGVGYSIKGASIDAEFDYLFSKAVMAGIAASYWYKDYAGISIGYHYGTDRKKNVEQQTTSIPLSIPSYLSIGIGGQIKGIYLNLTYLTASKTLSNTVCLSAGYRF